MTSNDSYSITKRPSILSLVASWLNPGAPSTSWPELTIEGERHIPGFKPVAANKWVIRVEVEWLGRNRYMDQVWVLGRGQGSLDSPTHGRITTVFGELDTRHEEKSWLIVPDELCRSIPGETSGMTPQLRALENAMKLSDRFGLGLLGELMARKVLIDAFSAEETAAH